jgi:hypothetical protein
MGKELRDQKKLRSCEADLLVVVGEEKKEYRYHSQIMAAHSNYIDTMLANPMKESQSLSLSFPDLTPAVWELMMKFLDPVHSRNFAMSDVMKVARAYDQYDFARGRQLCDSVVFDYFIKVMPEGTYDRELKPDDLDCLIDAFLLADEVNLEKAKKQGVIYFKGALQSFQGFGRSMFTEPQIGKLVPLIAKEKLMKDMTEAEILSPLFSRYVIGTCLVWENTMVIGKAVTGLELRGTGTNADGEYKRELSVFSTNELIRWDGVDRLIRIGRIKSGDWVIYGETVPERGEDGKPINGTTNKKILWKNPYSRNKPLPPESGWTAVGERFQSLSQPKIKYISRGKNYF